MVGRFKCTRVDWHVDQPASQASNTLIRILTKVQEIVERDFQYFDEGIHTLASIFCRRLVIQILHIYLFLLLKNHSHPNGFYWGHQWTLTTAKRSPTCSLMTATGSNQAYGWSFTFRTNLESCLPFEKI